MPDPMAPNLATAPDSVPSSLLALHNLWPDDKIPVQIVGTVQGQYLDAVTVRRKWVSKFLLHNVF